METLERRFLSSSIRTSESGGRKIIGGYAARWNSLSQNLAGFRERLAVRCFDLDADDQRMLLDHDSGRLLGRKSTGTLEIVQDGTGLRFRCTLPDTQDAADAYSLIKRGDLDGMSFGMLVADDDWDDEYDPDDPDQKRMIRTRTVKRARCLEISCVVFPAYSSSSVETMSRALWPAGMPAEVRSRTTPPTLAELRRRIALAQADLIDPSEQQERLKLRARLAALDL